MPLSCRLCIYLFVHLPSFVARNVLLLTLVADKQPCTTTVWNIFFHIFLDYDSHSIMIEHCRKLVQLSDSLDTWNDSVYGHFIRMSTEHTLVEIRRYWSLYIHMQQLPNSRIQSIRDSFSQHFKSAPDKVVFLLSPARSAGPLFSRALRLSTTRCTDYWRTGVTFSSPHEIARAKLLNPSFVYSLAGEGCSVHFATDPLAPFHHAALFCDKADTATIPDLVEAAKSEFNDWCAAFLESISPNVPKPPIIRFFLGDAIAVCSALHAFDGTGALKLEVPVSQWSTHLIHLNEGDYVAMHAPATFNVIDTSNLDDHIGLFNVLIAAVPLLSATTQSSVLYTESLLVEGKDATKEFVGRLYANLTVIGFLIGICPVDYLSGFTTRANLQELIFHKITKGQSAQFHQVTTWKSPVSGDVPDAQLGDRNMPPAFEPRQLGALLYDMYQRMFEQEDPARFLKLNNANLSNALSHSNLVHYTRETFVLFLKLVRNRLRISEGQWLEVMGYFFDFRDADRPLLMNSGTWVESLNHQDLCMHLYHHDVFTVPVYQEKLPKIDRLSHLEVVCPLVRIVLVVPRAQLAVLGYMVETIPTLLLQIEVEENIFTSVHAAFGTATLTGSTTWPQVVFEEDPDGWKGTSPLITSFTMPARLLASDEVMENINVCLTIKATVGTMLDLNKLGLSTSIFRASFTNESAVYILPEPRKNSTHLPTISLPAMSTAIGKSSAAMVELDEQCELVVSLTCKVSVDNEKVRGLFTSGAIPQVSQSSPCILKLAVGQHMQNIIYPFPVIGSQSKLRIARKSLYIEVNTFVFSLLLWSEFYVQVVVPPFGPLKPDGMKLNPFAVINANGSFTPWSIHRLNLTCLPTFDDQATGLDSWLGPHVGAMFSARERHALRLKQVNDPLTFVKDTIDTIFGRSLGIRDEPVRRLFALRDKPTTECDTIFFVGDMRFDLHSHTIVCDAYVLPMTPLLMQRIGGLFGKLVQWGNIFDVSVYEGEMQAWKQLLPALAERCRTSWKHGDSCEYKTKGKIPVTDEMHEDPLCSCGRGKDVKGMKKVELWSKLAPYVTRIALSPLFAVSYLETVVRDPLRRRCFVCRLQGKPKGKLMTCSKCQIPRYCSKACQKIHWEAHKRQCKSNHV
jgi:MYND finger